MGAAAATITLILATTTATATACSIDGRWHYNNEQYDLKMDAAGATAGALTATVVPGHVGHCTWCTAKGTLGADGSVAMHYDNGDSNTGTLAKDCASLSWGWKRGAAVGAEEAAAEAELAAAKPCVPGGGHPTPPAPKKAHPEIEVVHVINSCHLDIGFADSSQGIINRYFDHHFPLAAQEGKAFRSGDLKGPHPKQLNFMFQSWVVNMYLDCPPGMGLHCPNATAIATFEEAVRAGDITWHAFPHNAQLEIMDPVLIQAGIQMTHDLDDRFGLPHKHTLSQRDVPGMTRSIIPIIKAYGVDAITVGANDGSTPPNVPDVKGGRDWTEPMPFVWEDPVSGEDILAMWNWPGYGSYPHNPPVLVPGLKHALVYNFAGDNGGPQTIKAYQALWSMLQLEFPNAEIIASTFDNYTDVLKTQRDDLPKLSKEIGDTWVYGVPSDPQKQARVRVINRAFSAAITKLGGAKALHTDKVLQNATRFALKLGEHTDGRDVKSNLVDNYSWKKADFERAKAKGSKNYSQYAILEESWWEQRQWGVTLAIDTLANAKHPLAEVLKTQVADLQPKVPTRDSSYRLAHPDEVFQCGGGGGGGADEDEESLSISFDGSGAIDHLSYGGVEWADANHTLAQLKYRSYSAKDVGEFFAQYCKSNAGWVQHDYGKPGLPDDVVGKIWTTTMLNLWVKQQQPTPADHQQQEGQEGQESSGSSCSFIAQTAFDPEASSEYGAAAGWTTFEVESGGKLVVEVGMFNKSTTRIPEAMFMQFQPLPLSLSSADSAAGGTGGTWYADKLGEWIGESEIVPGGSQHLQGVMEGGLRYNLTTTASAAAGGAAAGGHAMTIGSTDAGLANFGELTAYPSPVNTSADTKTYGASFVLFDNLWGTNYVEWWPFQVPPPTQYADSSQYFPSSWNNDMLSRYTIDLS